MNSNVIIAQNLFVWNIGNVYKSELKDKFRHLTCLTNYLLHHFHLVANHHPTKILKGTALSVS